MTIALILALVTCAAAVIGAIVGIVKKATNLSFWGATTVLAVLVAQLVAKFVSKDSGTTYSILVLAITILAALLISAIFGGVKSFLNKRIQKACEYSMYKNKDAVEENEAYIMEAVDSKDKKQYKKLVKKGKKIKNSSGAWGVVNRLLGMASGVVDWVVATGCIISIVYLFIELCGMSNVQGMDAVQAMLTAPGWVNVGQKFSLDVMLVGGLIITVNSGFKRGIFHLITPIVVIALLVGFGFAAWSIACSTMCEGVVLGIKQGLLAQLAESGEGLADILAKVIIAAIIFLLSLIIVIIIGKLLPKLLDKFRDNDAFYVIDGILGAVLSLAIYLVALMAVGGIAYTLYDLPFMQRFTELEAQTTFANCLYQYNPMASLFANLPLRGWLEPAA